MSQIVQFNSSTVKSKTGLELYENCCCDGCLEGDLSISTIEKHYSCEFVQKTVETLVLERFGEEFVQQKNKSFVRHSKAKACSLATSEETSSGVSSRSSSVSNRQAEIFEDNDVFDVDHQPIFSPKTPKSALKFQNCRRKSQFTYPTYTTKSLTSDNASVSFSSLTDLLSVESDSCKTNKARLRLKSSQYELIKREIRQNHGSVELFEKVLNYEKTMTQYLQSEQNNVQFTPKLVILHDQLEAGEQTIAQIEKAIQLSPISEEFYETRLEAEKLLLVKLMERDQILKQIKTSKIYESLYWNIGEVTVSAIEFRVKLPKNVKLYFFCLIQHENAIKSTEICQPDDKGLVQFQSIRHFDNVGVDFKVTIKIFYTTHKNRQKINKQVKQKVTSSFSFWAETELTMENLKQYSEKIPYTLAPVEFNSDLDFYARISGEPHLENLHIAGGFLDVGELQPNKSIAWNQTFCLLQGATLQFLNHPSDQLFGKAKKFIDFNASNAKIGHVERDECRRKNAIRLETEHNGTIDVYFLNATSQADLEYWRYCLSVTISTVQGWKDFDDEVFY